MSGPPPEVLLKRVEKFLLTSCNKNIFTASSIAFFYKGYNKGRNNIISCGTTGDDKKTKITDYTLFDLASLTKPLVTLLSVLTLIDENKLSWLDTVDSLLPGCLPTSCNEVTIFHLLCHSSGLPAHKEYWPELYNIDLQERKKWLINEIVKEEKVYETGTDHIYSDLGYILLGFIIEEKTGQTMENFWSQNIVKALGLEKHLMFPDISMGNDLFAATLSFGKQLLHGVVHDDNCRGMGGIGGHAGLFGTAQGVLTICQELIRLLTGEKSKLPFSSQTLQRACSRVETSEWTPGFNLPSPQNSSSGTYFSKESLGHLGFTGTSLWIDPVRELAVVFLTNRVLKGVDQKGIRELRPFIHDYILKEMGIKTPPSSTHEKKGV